MSSILQTILLFVFVWFVNICLFGLYASSFDIHELIIEAIRKSINAINLRAR